MILHPHRLPLYPTPQCIYTYTQGVAGTKTAGDAHAQKSNSRPYGINRSVRDIELKSRPS